MFYFLCVYFLFEFIDLQKFCFVTVTKDIPVNTPNLNIWNLKTKQSVKSYVQKNHSKWYSNKSFTSINATHLLSFHFFYFPLVC